LPEIIGHRGYSARAPENTLESLAAAIDAGADAVEFDLHVAACGTPVLIHDPTLERTTDGEGAVVDHPFSELCSLDAGSWFSPDFGGASIPALHEALDLAGGGGARVYAEVKGYRTLMDLYGMVEITRRARMTDLTVFISMDWAALESLRSMDREVAVGYIVERADRNAEGLERAVDQGNAILDFDARILAANPAMAASAVRAGVPLAVWTVNEAETAETLWSMGVERFTTDEVDILIDWRSSVGGATS